MKSDSSCSRHIYGARAVQGLGTHFCSSFLVSLSFLILHFRRWQRHGVRAPSSRVACDCDSALGPPAVIARGPRSEARQSEAARGEAVRERGSGAALWHKCGHKCVTSVDHLVFRGLPWTSWFQEWSSSFNFTFKNWSFSFNVHFHFQAGRFVCALCVRKCLRKVHCAIVLLFCTAKTKRYIAPPSYI